jgi:hypothetical protein
MLRALSFCLLLTIASCQTWNQNTPFANTAVLNDNVNLQWNFTATDIFFRLAIRTNGWVGFGLSPNGGMANSDIMLAWTNPDGAIQFQDASTANRNVWPNIVQNWQRLFYSRTNGLTTVIFTRKIKVCVAPGQPTNETNIDVEPTSYVIWAYGDNFQNRFPTYHGNTRGSRSLPLLVANEKVQLQGRIDEASFVVNVNAI